MDLPTVLEKQKELKCGTPTQQMLNGANESIAKDKKQLLVLDMMHCNSEICEIGNAPHCHFWTSNAPRESMAICGAISGCIEMFLLGVSYMYVWKMFLLWPLLHFIDILPLQYIIWYINKSVKFM